MYTCPKCKESHFSGVKKLLWHLREIHTLSDGQDFTIVCTQDGCPRTYHSFNSFSKHLYRDHPTATCSNTVLQACSQTWSEPSGISAVNEMETNYMPTVNLKIAPLNDVAASFVAQQYSSSNVTLMDVSRSINCTKDVLDITLSSLQQSTKSVLNCLNIPHDNDAVKVLLNEFESAKQIFKEVDTPFKMKKYFSKKFGLVKPKEFFLGHRADTARRNGQFKQVLAADTYQYVSVIETIRFLFHNKTFQKLYLQKHKSTDGKLRDYCDGAHFSSHPLFDKYPEALQLQLYFDDLETTNPLGSKTKIHKMGAVYFSIMNLPPEYNSSLENIHLCILFNSIDKDVYGFDKIFEPLINDLRHLERFGIFVELEGHNHQLFGTLCLLTADNLAIHSLGGYLESFSANKFCHFCLIDKNAAQYVFDGDQVEKRTRQNYQEHVELDDPSLTGIKAQSCLNKLHYFHVTENICVDLMHDILEGVAPLEVKLMLRYYVQEEKCFTLNQLNQRISSFEYGFGNEKNKPSIILNLKSENAVKQTASQMWCLLLVLPFMLGDLVDVQSRHWHLFILLREICSIIFAPVVTCGLAVLLKQLVIDHHTLFKILYPEKNLIPKHHFMIHYPQLMLMFGPLSKLWCMRFEAKHNPLKRHAHAVCNLKNVSKTLAYKHQIQQMHKQSNSLSNRFNVTNTYPINVGSLKKANVVLDYLKLLVDDITLSSTIYVSHSVGVLGHTYRTGSVLPLRNDYRGELLFGEIVHIIPQASETILMLVRVLIVKHFDDHFFAYIVQRSKEYEVICYTDVIDHRPLDILSNFKTCELYLNPRYTFVCD